MKPASYFPALTGLRAVAAYCVFFFHFPPVVAGGPWAGQALHALCREGHIGVSLFFTLSGFLICRRYYQQSFSGRQLGRYALRRWARIYPVFLLVTTLTFLLSKLYLTDHALQLYLVNISLLKGFAADWAFTGVAQTWSLTVEECFYLLAPLLFWLGRRFSPFVWAGVALVLLGLGWVLYAGLPSDGGLRFSAAHFMLVATIFGRSTEFLLGAAFALLAARYSGRRTTWTGSLGLLLLLLVLTGIQLYTGKVSIDTPVGVAVNNLLLPAATGLLLWGLTTETTGLQRLLSSAPLQLAGKASYCFYLLHMGFWHDYLLRWLPAQLPAALSFTLVFLLTIAASIGLYYLVEKPLHRLIISRFAPRPEAQPAVSF
ncbi:acyltransferase [Hymenobacter sp. BT635]|uniref:Acyltransferase n=1 Tax=Hymenobacter nitidus TaxID=2880929 RepID=A0ABS8A8M6_9BACT|nr:acyltransferase [Hymenobacter nitidus]MCB2376753.1 acyltransferase [Hymenobacter nitidus]